MHNRIQNIKQKDKASVHHNKMHSARSAFLLQASVVALLNMHAWAKMLSSGPL